MDPKSRFYGCESEGFPAISNYDFETNKAIRGINDRQFRWEDVATESVYQLNEATTNGSFETTSYVPVNPTGLSLLASGSTTYSGFSGWVCTGSFVTYVGISGATIHSGQLSGVTSSFTVHPLDQNNALGLYCFNTGSRPIVISSTFGTGDEGPVVIEGTHQVYLKAKLGYGSSGNLLTYVRGWSAGNIVAYYNHISGAWQTTLPLENIHPIGSGVEVVKYNFIADDFPAATPDSFDICISNITSGSFITVDDCHIDAYFKKNAYIDYLVPSGYFIQVTPDLGWHNILSMFDSNELNPHLRTIGPYIVEYGNLTDNLDNSVTATVDYADLQSVTTSNFKKYLWRALPVTPNGEVGAGGLPQKFSYVGDQVNTLFTVDKIIDDPTSTTKTIIGTKGVTMTVLVDGIANNPGLTYPSTSTWKLVINLSSSTRVLSLQGKDVGGATSSIRRVTLSNPVFNQNTNALWNIFDEHGLVADVERLPNESNYDYSLRIKDKYKNRTGPNFVGIVNGASNELAISKVSDAILLSLSKNIYGVEKTKAAKVEVTSYSIRIEVDSFIVQEKLLVDPVFGTIDLSYRPKDIPIYAELEGAGRLNLKDISIELLQDDYLLVNRFKFIDTSIYGRYVTVTYNYIVEFLFKDYPTLESVINAVNNLTDLSGQKVLSCEINQKLSGNESALGLFISQKTITPTSSAGVDWSPIRLKKVSDRGYRNYFIDDNTVKDSKYYEYVKELKDGIKIFWGNVEADRDRWDSNVNKTLALDSIPTLFDPPITKMISMLSGQQERVEAITAWGRSYKGFSEEYLMNAGLTQDVFQPGVAHTNDLTPNIKIYNTSIEIDSSLDSNISDIKNNNNYLIFSGQR